MRHILVIGVLMVSIVGFAQVDVRKNATFFSKGIECKYKEDVEGAITNFEQALVFMPDDAASMFELSEQYVKKGMIEEGFMMSKSAAELDPDNKWYQMRLALFYRNFKQYDEFADIYEKLTSKYPNDVEMLAELIDVYLIAEEYDKALDKLDVLEKQAGFNALVSEQRIEIYKQQNNTKKLIAELEKLIALYPENTRYYHMLANVYMESGKEKEAIKLYEQIKTFDPEDPYINISLLEYYEKQGDDKKAFDELIAAINNKNLDFNTKLNIYEYWFGKKDVAEEGVDLQAKRCGEAFVENYPDNKIGYAVLGTYYMAHLDTDQEKAQTLFNKALSIDSTDYFSWRNLIIIDVNSKDFESTYQHAKKALKYYPMQPVFYWYAGTAASFTNRKEEALTYLEKGRRFATEKAEFVDFDVYIGDLYHEQGDDENAFAAYDRVLRNDPDHALTLNNYAYYLSLKGEKLDKALEMAKHAVELEPENEYYLDTYAWVLYKLERYNDAEYQLRRCMNLKKSLSGSSLEHYGDILFKLERFDEAVEYWEKAQKKGGGSKLLDKKIKDKTLYE